MNDYRNPLEVSGRVEQNRHFYLADPYVMRYAGCYYCYNTSHDGVTLLVSSDLLHFQYAGYALQCENQQEYWAPCVVHHNGTFYMYYSSRACEEEDVHMQRLKVATAESPLGPFSYKATLHPSFAIDADVIVSQNKEWVIYYATNDFRGNDLRFPGTCIVEDRLETPFKLVGEPREIIVPSNRKEMFCKNRFGDGRDWYTIEAPCLYENLNRQFLLYSGNAYTSEEYFVDYAQTNGIGWKKRGGMSLPLLHSSKQIKGTGHNSITKAPNLIDDWVVYHGMRELPEVADQETRELCVSRLIPSEKKLRLLEPPSGFIHCPWCPEVYCFTPLAETPDLSLWEELGGTWHFESAKLTQSNSDTKAILLLQKETRGYVCEVSIEGIQTARNSLWGLVAAYIDDRNYTNILIDTGRQELQIHHVKSGIRHVESYPMQGYDFAVLHTLRVERSVGWLRVCVDDEIITETAITVEPAKTGLVSVFSQATYTGFSFNEFYRIDASNFCRTRELLKAPYDEEMVNALCCADGTIICGETPVCFGELIDPEWQLFMEFSCLSQYDIKPTFQIGFSSTQQNSDSLCAEFDYLSGTVKVYNGNEEYVYQFSPQESDSVVFIKRSNRLFVYADGLECSFDCDCSSCFSFRSCGCFKVHQILLEKIC